MSLQLLPRSISPKEDTCYYVISYSFIYLVIGGHSLFEVGDPGHEHGPVQSDLFWALDSDEATLTMAVDPSLCGSQDAP